MENEFCFIKMNQLYENGQLKDHLDCKNYISKYLHPLTNGTHALTENDTISIIQKETLNEVYLQRFEDDIKKWYKKKTIPKKLICDIHKPVIGNNFINLGKQLKHKYSEYAQFDPEIKVNVELMLSYIKEVWANNDEKVYQYLLKWLSNMVRGNKNKTCIYAKCLQGAGKSTLLEFIRDHVIGRDITCKGKADHLKGQHNLQLLGRIFVYFEELQFFTDKEWYAIDSEMKDMITDEVGSYTDKYEKRFEAQKINNYMIVTNSRLKGVNGRRYLVVDLSSKRLDDFVYYGNLRDMCFNDEVGLAFYCYLMEINIDNFNSLDMPETKNKLALISELLPPIEKFLKFNFVLRNASINMKLKDLWMLYKDFDHGKSEDVSIQRFSEPMRELGFEYSKQSGYSTYKISIDELNNIAKKRKWLHELDKDLMMKPTNDDNECMFIDKTDKAEYIRAEDHKIVLDKLKKVEQSNKYMTNDLNDAMKYISQLESYVYKLENKLESNETDVDEVDDEVVDEVIDETDDVVETKLGMKFNFELNKDNKGINYVTQALIEEVIKYSLSLLTKNKYVNKINLTPKIVKNHNYFILVWDGEFEQIEDIFMHIGRQIAKSDIFDNIPFINEYNNSKNKVITLYKENETDVDEVVDEPSNETEVQTDVTDVDETNVDEKDIDFVEIGNNVFLNKKTNQTYEIVDDNDLDEDLF